MDQLRLHQACLLVNLEQQGATAVERLGDADPQPADCCSRDDGATVNAEGAILTVRLGIMEAGATICGVRSSVRGRDGTS